MPHHPHISEVHRPQIALVGAEVPHPSYAAVDLLRLQHLQLLRADRQNGRAKAQVPVEARADVGLADRPHQVDHLPADAQHRLQADEDELIAGPVDLRHHVQRLVAAAQLRVDEAVGDGGDVVEASKRRMGF